MIVLVDKKHQIIFKISLRACVLSNFSHVQLFAILWIAACQTPLSMGFSGQESLDWVAMPFSRGSSQPGGGISIFYISCLGRRIIYPWATWKAPLRGYLYFNKLCFVPKPTVIVRKFLIAICISKIEIAGLVTYRPPYLKLSDTTHVKAVTEIHCIISDSYRNRSLLYCHGQYKVS